MKVAYLINQYPKVSHSFIRREILAVEAQGIEVSRFSIRSLESELIDTADQQEYEKTRFILRVGIWGLLWNLLRVGFTHPWRLWQSAWLALKLGWGSERGVVLHGIYLAEACVLLQWLSQAKINHLHVHFGTNSATVALLCQALGGPPYSFTVHGPEEFDKPGAIALPEKIKQAKFVVAISSFGKSQLFRWCNYQDWSKIQIVHCGVDPMFLDHPFVPLPSERRFVCVGRLSEQKGHLMLVEAVSKLVSAGFEFKLVFVGDGSLRNEIEQLINRFGLENYIEITGWATNTQVQQYILSSQVFVLPSFAEGLPVVLMEALALSRPVISTYIAGIPELVEPGKNGWLVPPGSLEDLTLALKTALTTPLEDLATMGKLGAAKVVEHHNINIEAQKLTQLFKKSCQTGKDVLY
jgi:colanic acid/amylovoran biosynthesis glycosyltransferase